MIFRIFIRVSSDFRVFECGLERTRVGKHIFEGKTLSFLSYSIIERTAAATLNANDSDNENENHDGDHHGSHRNGTTATYF